MSRFERWCALLDALIGHCCVWVVMVLYSPLLYVFGQPYALRDMWARHRFNWRTTVTDAWNRVKEV